MNTAISLGWDCGPASYGVSHKLREIKIMVIILVRLIK